MSNSPKCVENGSSGASGAILHTVTDADSSERLPITVIKAISHVLGVCPEETQLNIQEYAELDELYGLKDPSLEECDDCITVGFPYRQMRVRVCSHGNVSIFGNSSKISNREKDRHLQES
jgi:hypothetical protein